ncbi:MAG TPA: hypothetical protein PLH44_02560 [Bacilli bacterium]|jgi:hypothetical protein|nr:hypothetical protein [Bacilli bacterium]HPL55390.1 hypothetical protein [Bacilli bacterium]
MKNRKTEKNVYSYGIQLLVLGIIIAVLIIGFLILINGIEIQGNSIIKNNFIVALFCSSIMGGAFLSFSTTNRLLKFQTSFGITRKKIYKAYLLRIIQVFSWLIGIYLFYTIADFMIMGQNCNLIPMLFNRKTVILILLFLLINMVGFWCGIRQIRIELFAIILLIIFVTTFLLYYFQIDNVFVFGGFGVAIVVLFFNNYKTITKGKIG